MKAATEKIKADLENVAREAQMKFDQQQDGDARANQKIEIFGQVAEQMSTEATRKSEEQENKINLIVDPARKEYEHQRKILTEQTRGGQGRAGAHPEDG